MLSGSLRMPDDDPLSGTAKFKCSSCEKEQLLKIELSCKLQVGDAPYIDPRNPGYGKCKICRRRALRAVVVPSFTQQSKIQGFWKPPTGGDSPDTKTE